jgi:hypothetical protein
MTLALDSHHARPPARLNLRIGAGIALSLAAHALLLALHRQPAAPAPPPPAPPAPLTLRLRAVTPPPPAPALRPVPSAPAPARTAERAGTPHAQRPARAPRAVIAVTPEQRQSQDPTYAVKPAPETMPETTPKTAPEAAPEPAPAAPRFDLAAARGMARKLANAPDPDKAGTALERLPPPPLQTENKFERAIKGAKRADCKDGVPGGLFAPLFLAMDKKDSGCKW